MSEGGLQQTGKRDNIYANRFAMVLSFSHTHNIAITIPERLTNCKLHSPEVK